LYRPTGIIAPAISHPEVIIAAIAARDPEKGKAYAKKHNIPKVHTSYQGEFYCSRMRMRGG
jgi:predicted dehydrogenase